MYEDQPEEQLEEIEIEAIGIEVNAQPIELYKIFKIANLVNGGGEAKHIISEGYVAVNGEIETRKRRKVYDGDLIEFNQEYYLIICDEVAQEEPEVLPESTDETDVFYENVQEGTEPVAEPEEEKQDSEKKENNKRKSINFF